MIKKYTKSFALDDLTLEAIKEIKEYLSFKNDSEVVTYAIFNLVLDKNTIGIKQRLDQEIARRVYSNAVRKSVNFGKRIK